MSTAVRRRRPMRSSLCSAPCSALCIELFPPLASAAIDAKLTPPPPVCAAGTMAGATELLFGACPVWT